MSTEYHGVRVEHSDGVRMEHMDGVDRCPGNIGKKSRDVVKHRVPECASAD